MAHTTLCGELHTALARMVAKQFIAMANLLVIVLTLSAFSRVTQIDEVVTRWHRCRQLE